MNVKVVLGSVNRKPDRRSKEMLRKPGLRTAASQDDVMPLSAFVAFEARLQVLWLRGLLDSCFCNSLAFKSSSHLEGVPEFLKRILVEGLARCINDSTSKGHDVCNARGTICNIIMMTQGGCCSHESHSHATLCYVFHSCLTVTIARLYSPPRGYL